MVLMVAVFVSLTFEPLIGISHLNKMIRMSENPWQIPSTAHTLVIVAVFSSSQDPALLTLASAAVPFLQTSDEQHLHGAFLLHFHSLWYRCITFSLNFFFIELFFY